MLTQMEILNKTVLHTLISAYRPGYSCQNVLLYMLSSISEALDNGLCAGAVTTDLSSAFDCLPPNLMYHKLIAYGVSPKSALLIHNYLSNRSQRVKIGSVVGEWMHLAKGTPQGSKLGPALFNLFINDLLYTLPEGSAVNFADDNTLYAVDSSPQSLTAKLNTIVQIAQKWYIENGMQSNPTKFQSIFFGRTVQCDILVDNVLIQPANFIKLLGITLDNELKFDTHVTNICITAGRNLNAIKRVGKYLPVKVKLLLYQTYMSCHFNFCPLVWHFCGVKNTTRLEKLQYRALRFVFDDYDGSYEDLLARAKMPSLELGRQRQMCLEVFKCIHNTAPQYMCDLFTCNDKSIHNTRSVKSIVQHHVNTVNHGRNTFVTNATHLWNNLPNNIKNTSNLDTFKEQLNTWAWAGPQCNCNFLHSNHQQK